MAKAFTIALLFWASMFVTWKLASILTWYKLNANLRTRVTNLGDLPAYRDANAALPQDPNRVVFFGDSITYQWDLSKSFHNPNYVNRGIRGQTSADMLVRFRQDVIELHPTAVVILAGVNDFGEHYPGGDENEQHKLENVAANDQTMAELAELHHIRPVFLSLTPLHDYTRQGEIVSGLIPVRLILQQNRWLKGFCELHGYQYIDVYSAMIDQRGMLRKQFSEDGVHPNDAGYAVMANIFSLQFSK